MNNRNKLIEKFQENIPKPATIFLAVALSVAGSIEKIYAQTPESQDQKEITNQTFENFYLAEDPQNRKTLPLTKENLREQIKEVKRLISVVNETREMATSIISSAKKKIKDAEKEIKEYQFDLHMISYYLENGKAMALNHAIAINSCHYYCGPSESAWIYNMIKDYWPTNSIAKLKETKDTFYKVKLNEWKEYKKVEENDLKESQDIIKRGKGYKKALEAYLTKNQELIKKFIPEEL